MRRQVDHRLARARAVGRRESAHCRAEVWPSLVAVERAVGRLYPDVRLDIDGDKQAVVRVERQDLDEMLGNLVEYAATYGGGTDFVSVMNNDHMVRLFLEVGGTGISDSARIPHFAPGARQASGQTGDR